MNTLYGLIMYICNKLYNNNNNKKKNKNNNNNNKLRILHFLFVVAEYGVTATDSAVCLIERSTFQRCRIFGARFLREANGTLLDCALQQSTLHGAKMMRSKPSNQV